MDKKLDELRKDISVVLAKDEIIVDEITFKEDGKYSFLTIVLDKVGGIDLDTIVEATKKINPIVDQKDFGEKNYILDIISKERG